MRFETTCEWFEYPRLGRRRWSRLTRFFLFRRLAQGDHYPLPRHHAGVVATRRGARQHEAATTTNDLDAPWRRGGGGCATGLCEPGPGDATAPATAGSPGHH